MDAYYCWLFLEALTQLEGALRKDKFVSRHFFDRLPPSVCVMCKSGQPTTSITSTDAELATATCQDPTRRAVILTALATGACLASSRSSIAEEDLPGSNERPQKADVLVFAEGERAGEVIKPQDLKEGGPPVRAWPKDPKTSVVRKGSRLNEVLVVRLDPAELDEETRPRAADGVVAYSAICVHTGCPITAWVKAAGGDKDVFKCVCHNSEYDPRQGAQVIFGPAPRRLPALPLAADDGQLTVAATFVGKVGAQQAK
jgi:rieske iron-sulfur protein